MEAEALGLSAAARALLLRLVGHAGGAGVDRDPEVALRKFAGGQSNPTYLLTVTGGGTSTGEHAGGAGSGGGGGRGARRYVLRKKPPGTAANSRAHAVEREFAVMRQLREESGGQFAEVPKVLALWEDEQPLGTAFYIMEFVRGEIWPEPVLAPGCSRTLRRNVYLATARQLGKLHSVDYVRAGLKGFGKESHYYRRQVRTLARVAKAQAEHYRMPESTETQFRECLSLLGAYADRAVDDVRCVVHGDYRIDNIVFARQEANPDKVKVLAVLDWELATIGHPMADVANLSLMYRIPYVSAEERERKKKNKKSVSPITGLLGLDLEEMGIPSLEEMVRVYREHSPFGMPKANPRWRMQEELWPFFVAFTLLKNAVVVQGILARVEQGRASNRQAKALAPLLHVLIQQALDELHSLSPLPERNTESQSIVATRVPQAVIFDVGGVLTDSPLPRIRAFERAHRPPLPLGYIGASIHFDADEPEGQGLFRELERGRRVLDDSFLREFRAWLLAPRTKRRYLERMVASGKRSKPDSEAAIRRQLAAVDDIDVHGLFGEIAKAASRWRPEMVQLCHDLRAAGKRVAVLTNDFFVPSVSSGVGHDRHGGVVEEATARGIADVYIDSKSHRFRKPDPAAYVLALHRLGDVPAENTLFVDDLRVNTDAAAKLGMQVVHARHDVPVDDLAQRVRVACGLAVTAPQIIRSRL